MKFLNYLTLLSSVLTFSTLSIGAECIDSTHGLSRVLCAEVPIGGSIKTVGLALDLGADLNSKKVGLDCIRRGMIEARVDFKADILQEGEGWPKIGAPYAVQVRETLQCLPW